MDINTTICPLLLYPELYQPDSVDLLKDEAARNYWLKCLEGIGNQFVDKADYLHNNDRTAKIRAKKSRDEFHEVLNNLKKNPK